VTNPYPPPPYDPYGPPPDTNLVWGILTTVMCCLPLGIVSIIKANEVNKLWYQGRHDEARKASAQARRWAIWSAIIPVVVAVGAGLIAAIGAALSEYGSY